MFDHSYDSWYGRHLHDSSGNRRERLANGHGYAEKLFLQNVWFPALKSFDHLHPEYEVSDFKDGSRYIDFAYIRFPLKLAIEIDGYGPHSAKLSRSQFSDSLLRQNHLTMDGWRILRFSYDDINEKPRMCEQLLQQFMGIWSFGSNTAISYEEYLEQEVLKYALQLDRKLNTKDVCDLLQIHTRKANLILRNMLHKGSLLPGGEGTKLVRVFQVNRSYVNGRKLFG
ncbi:DNA-binding response regulator [Paenibacillus marinisediminis]